MGILTEHKTIETIERLRFFTGQRLFASDVQSIEAFNREMRWLHNQSLHQPGIGMGFSVNGEMGGREVIVAPGYGIDSVGREIVLTQKRILSIPPVSDDGFGNPVNYDLTISYQDDRLLEEAGTKERIQLSNDAVRLREEPVFHWIELGQNLQPKDDQLKADIKNGLKMVLKRIAIQNCRLKKIFTDLEPRKASTEGLVHIYAGKTDPEKTNWTFWTESHPKAANHIGVPIGVKVQVDTSDARFKTPPHYFAHIEGERIATVKDDPDCGPYLLDGVANITGRDDMSFQRGFELRLLMPQFRSEDIFRKCEPTSKPPPTTESPVRFGADFGPLATLYHPMPFVSVSLPLNPGFFFEVEHRSDMILKKLNWHVVWMGIEG